MKLRLIRVALLFLSLWFVSCSSSAPQGPDEQPAEQPAAASDEGEAGDRAQQMADSDIIPVGDSPILGEVSAPVTVVVFSDLQCPFCQRGAKTMHELQQKYPEDVRVVFKHYPLPFHKQAPDAAKATIAAGNQGKFWEMHDWLFENFKQLKDHSGDMKEWTAAYANELGLDVVVFKRDFDAAATQKTIDDDMALGQKLQVRGTPHFFVNGERVVGARPLAAFEKAVHRRLQDVEEFQQDDVASDELYKKAVAETYEEPSERPKARPNKPTTNVEYVPVDASDPMFGNTVDPLVTIVAFSDFQCPFCGKVVPTLDQIKKEYGDQVRVVFKQLPLGMHQQAKPAAKAALAAHQQGKFWEMHDELFAEQREMRQHGDDFKEWSAGLAKSLGLNVAKFEEDFDSDAIAQKIEDDVALSQKVGVRGTPNFWINGVNLRGAQPLNRFKSVIDEQISVAQKIEADEKISGDALYKEVVAVNKESHADGKPEPAPSRADKPAPKVDLAKLGLGGAPIKGPKNAPVTIIAFSDFQCPYCSRGGANVFEAMNEFPGQVKFAFKHYPLPFHKQAPDAAKAAMAAGEQGKFWEMHDKLFEEQRRLREDGILEELAEEIGLDVRKFKADMAKPEYQKAIDEDMKQGQAVGVRGTPAFFINGTRIVGAQPTAKFEEAIEEAIEEAK
jgi:protein-disulfide isomerase